MPTPTPAEIKAMQDNPTDEVLEAFEQKYGPGSTRTYAAPSKITSTPTRLKRRRRKSIAEGG